MCGFPAHPADAAYVEFDGAALVLGLCCRCVIAQKRLPRGTALKRINAAARRGLADGGRYYAARFPDLGAAQIVAGMLWHPRHADEALKALRWIPGILEEFP